MNKIKKNIKAMIFKIKIILNKIYCFKNAKKFTNKVAIVSCDKWQNKVKEDILLKIELNKLNLNADIISWQNKNTDLKKYDLLIIRSVWGYQDYLPSFISWLDKISNSNIKILNKKDILLTNMNKKEQFELLDKYNIPHIKTNFLSIKDIENNNIKDIENNNDIVIKPIISGSGNNTYVISNNIEKNSIKLQDIKKKFLPVLNDYNNYLMIQPFIKEINNGELSLIYIKKELKHAVIRYTSIFNDRKSIQVIDLKNIDSKAISLANKISEIPELNEYLYLRVDLINTNNAYQVMEIELVEPCLFLEYHQNKKSLIDLAQAIKEEL